jgi:hypothetical protein
MEDFVVGWKDVVRLRVDFLLQPFAEQGKLVLREDEQEIRVVLQDLKVCWETEGNCKLKFQQARTVVEMVLG